MADPLNTHSYDGKINSGQIPDLESVKFLSLERKRECGKEFIAAVSGKISPPALSYLSQIVASIGSSANIDPTNGLIADDMICLCWVFRENPEFLSVLETQLMDMATGFCPQGRTHRLFQTLLAFI